MPLLEPEALALLRKLGGSALLARLVDLFAQTAPRRIADARAAEEQNDLAAVGRVAHSLRSSAGQLGARKLSEIAAAIEREAESGDSQKLRGLLDLLAQEYAAVAPLLAEEKARTADHGSGTRP